MYAITPPDHKERLTHLKQPHDLKNLLVRSRFYTVTGVFDQYHTELLHLYYYSYTMPLRLTDWRCVRCGSWTIAKRRQCRTCGKIGIGRRVTRGELRAREAEHRTQAILRRFGL